MSEQSTPKITVEVTIAAGAETLYAMIADVTRIGEFSPACEAAWWDEGSGPSVGSWFTGRNAIGERSYETRSEVVAADAPREFAWIVGGTEQGNVRWGYTFTRSDGGTTVAEHWELLRAGRWGANPAMLQGLQDRTRAGMTETLANLKRVAEGG